MIICAIPYPPGISGDILNFLEYIAYQSYTAIDFYDDGIVINIASR